MGNICVNLLDSVGAQKFLRHTFSIHPFGTYQNQSPTASITPSQCQKGFTILDRKTEPVEETYELGRELGRGQFGVIRHCIKRASGEEFACKSIEKCRLTTAGDVEDVRTEIQALQLLAGHPNIVHLVAVYEDADFVHIVMELCAGGELYDRIVKSLFSESEAALVIRTLMKVLQHCHRNGVIHRDLKPENILLTTEDPRSPIKVADFGLSARFNPGDRLSGLAGSAYYIAPEVLRGKYGEAVDVWSAGVVLYILLTGVPPFWDETEEGIFEAIRIGKIDLSSERWSKISSAAKELVNGMICLDVEKRLTPQQVLDSRWIHLHCSGTGFQETQVSESTSPSPSPSPDKAIAAENKCSNPRTILEDRSSNASLVHRRSEDEVSTLPTTKSLTPSSGRKTVKTPIETPVKRTTVDAINRNESDRQFSYGSTPNLATTRSKPFTDTSEREPVCNELLVSTTSGYSNFASNLATDHSNAGGKDSSLVPETINSRFLVVPDGKQRKFGRIKESDDDLHSFSCYADLMPWSPCSNSANQGYQMQRQSHSQTQTQSQPQAVY